MLGDLQSTRLIHLKGWLFLLIGLMSTTCLLIELANWRLAAMILVSIWAFCRFYYYAFYVIEKYTDEQYKFAGLGSFIVFWLKKKKS